MFWRVISDEKAPFEMLKNHFSNCGAVAMLKRVLQRPIVLTGLLGCWATLLTRFRAQNSF